MCVCVDLFFILRLLCCITVIESKVTAEMEPKRNNKPKLSIQHFYNNKPQQTPPTQCYTAKQQNKIKDDDDFAFVVAGTFVQSLSRLKLRSSWSSAWAAGQERQRLLPHSLWRRPRHPLSSPRCSATRTSAETWSKW